MAISDTQDRVPVEIRVDRGVLGKVINITLAGSAQEGIERGVFRALARWSKLKSLARTTPTDSSRIVTVTADLPADALAEICSRLPGQKHPECICAALQGVVAAFEQQAGIVDEGLFDLRGTGLLG